jgi:hypothetical protein
MKVYVYGMIDATAATGTTIEGSLTFFLLDTSNVYAKASLMMRLQAPMAFRHVLRTMTVKNVQLSLQKPFSVSPRHRSVSHKGLSLEGPLCHLHNTSSLQIQGRVIYYTVRKRIV